MSSNVVFRFVIIKQIIFMFSLSRVISFFWLFRFIAIIRKTRKAKGTREEEK